MSWSRSRCRDAERCGATPRTAISHPAALPAAGPVRKPFAVRRGAVGRRRESSCWARSSTAPWRADLKVGMRDGTDHHAALRRRRRSHSHRLRLEGGRMSEPVCTSSARVCTRRGKVGRDFTECGVVAARAALRDAGLDWRQIQLVAGAGHHPQRLSPASSPGATFAQKLGWTGIQCRRATPRALSGSQALQSARAPDHGRPVRCGPGDRRRHHPPKSFFAPVGGERRNDPDWQRFHLIGATSTVYFALLAPAPRWTSTAPRSRTSPR